MSGLVGYRVSHVDAAGSGEALAMSSANVGRSLQGENGQECRVVSEYSCKKTSDLRCGSGETLAGWDRDGCVSRVLSLFTVSLFPSRLSISRHARAGFDSCLWLPLTFVLPGQGRGEAHLLPNRHSA
jgi:hypothetical protein